MAAETRALTPGPPLGGSFAPPPSKSLAQRLLVIAALARGRTRIEGRSLATACCDVAATIELLRRAGAPLDVRSDEVAIGGGGAGAWSARAALSAGESATLARLATAVLALGPRSERAWTLMGEGTLLGRTSAPLFDSLRAAGAGVEHLAGRASWPVAIVPAGPVRACRIEHPCSSQEVSALLVALAALDGERELTVTGPIPSRPYLDLTIACLARFGVGVESATDGARTRFRAAGELASPPGALAVEPDASAAAVALAAACISDGELAIDGLPSSSLQPDVFIAPCLERFGCRAGAGPGGLSAGGRPQRGAALDLGGHPDLAPVLAAVGACAAWCAGGVSELRGLGALANKESPRVEVLAAALRALGLAVEASSERLRIAPGAPAGARTLRLDPRGDHRMAFAFALLGLMRAGILVADPGCVSKSWPSFWEDLARLGARVA